MSWLAPWFLLGALAVALPIWLHRLQTETPKRRRFASLMLLRAAERRVHVEKRLRYWLLLALRVLLLLLLALCFAKPLWQTPPATLAAVNARLHVLVLDTSLSMQAGDAWTLANKAAQAVIADAGPSDRLLLLAAGDELQRVAGPLNATTASKQTIRDALARLTPGASQLHYGAMINGVQALLTEETQPVLLHVFSDWQHSALPAQFGDLVPRAVNGRVMQVQLHAPDQPPSALANLAVIAVERRGNGVEALVQGWHNPAGTVTVSVMVNGVARAEQVLRVPASGVAVASFATVPLNTGSNRVAVQLKAAAPAMDALNADNVFYTVLDNSVGQPVPLLSAQPDSLVAKYLDAAWVAAGDRYRLQPQRVAQFDVRTLDRYRFVMIDDLGALPERVTDALVSYVQQGGAVLAAVGERSLTLRTLPLVGLPVAARTGATLGTAERSSVGALDMTHPALNRAAGLRAVTVARLVRVTPNAQTRVLAQLDDGAPLLLEQRLGQGRILLLTSSLDNTWNDLPVQPVFVSLLGEAGRYLAGETLLKRALRVGDSLPLEQAASAGQVIDPQGRSLLSLSDSQRVRSVRLSETGYYEVVTAGSSAFVAVNSSNEESDLTPMSAEELRSWQQAVAHNTTTSTASAPAASSGLELWHALLVVLGLLVLAESLLGNTYVNRRVETPS